MVLINFPEIDGFKDPVLKLMGLAKSIEPIIILSIILMLFPKICTDIGVFIAEKN